MKVKKDIRKTFAAVRHITLYPSYDLTKNAEPVAILL